VATADDYDLVQVYGWEPRVSVLPTWTVVALPPDALNAIGTPGFDPSRSLVLEREPGIAPAPGAQPGTATYREVSPEDIRVGIDAPTPSVVVVRNSYDPGWTATLDGDPVPVLSADYLLQGVAVPAGRHEIHLMYEDPDVTRGLAAGAAVWLILLAAIPAAVLLERRRSARRPDAVAQ
jgi:hypothetical protein